jgi:hypothetical protein
MRERTQVVLACDSGADNTEQCFPFGLTLEQISQLDSILSSELQTVYSGIQVSKRRRRLLILLRDRLKNY